jgi:hypothetical protein
MTFRLASSVSGRLRSGAVWLFDAYGTSGCFVMTWDLPPMDLVPNQSVLVTLRADIASEFCPMPLVIDRMTFLVYEDLALNSEQGFQIRYAFLP